MVRVPCGADLLHVGGCDLLICLDFAPTGHFNYNLPMLWNPKNILQPLSLKMRQNCLCLICLGLFYVGRCQIS